MYRTHNIRIIIYFKYIYFLLNFYYKKFNIEYKIYSGSNIYYSINQLLFVVGK